MLKEYKTVGSISGPLLLVESVIEAKFGHIVEIELPDGSIRRGQILEVDRDKLLIQVFEGTSGIDIPSSCIRILGRGVELALAPDILGRVFGGLGLPRDESPPLIAEHWADINGNPINPYARDYPN